MKKLKLLISIVVYKEKFSDIQGCLESIIHAVPMNIDYEIIVVDNGANALNNVSDIALQSAKHFNELPIFYIASPKNGGYGYGHNQAIFSRIADYHLIINGDVEVMPESLKNALEFMQKNPRVGMLVPDVYDSEGNRVYLCRQNPRLWISFLRRFAPIWLKKLFNKSLEKFEMRDRDYDHPIFHLSNPTGCFMFCRSSVLKAIHGFDEKLFLYYEDADLGRRLARISQIAYVPAVKIRHEWQRAAYHDKRLAWIAIKSAFYYAWKWR